jgi:V/A-type H+-transporting ATPase subunit F
LGLIGIEGEIAANNTQAETAFGNAISSKDTGIIIITERSAQMIREKVDNFIIRGSIPLIIEIPDRHGRVKGKKSAKEIIRGAIGIRI